MTVLPGIVFVTINKCAKTCGGQDFSINGNINYVIVIVKSHCVLPIKKHIYLSSLSIVARYRS